MTALATSADVVAELGRALTAAETAKVDAALDRASALVRAATERKFEAGTYTVRRRVRDGKVTVDSPSSVTSVTAVHNDGTTTALTSYTLRGSTIYDIGCYRWVEVVYVTAGAVPAELVGVVAAMTARDITEARPDGATSYTVTKGPFSESAEFDEPTDSVEPTTSEATIIRRYSLRRPGALSLL